MKKTFILFVLIIAAYSIQAQKLNLGLRFNPQITWFNIENADNKIFIDGSSARLGFSYGLMADVNFTDNYALATGVFHNIFGAKTNPVIPSPDTNVLYNYTKWKIQYIQIPLMLKMKTNEINSIVYYGQFGVTPFVKINGEIDGNTADNINFFNVFLSIGGGIHYSLGGNTAALAGITFNNGFVKVNDEDEFSAKSQYLSLDLGILF